ncbi:MAG: hypothetical protein F6K31_20715 [Symploca sp. SIO2G7]|nr:hypothetical protein [Symploca sp. SIO2G7]
MRTSNPTILISHYQNCDEQRHTSDEKWLDVWQQKLETLPPAPELPITQQPTSSDTQLTRYSQQIDATTWSNLKQRAVQANLPQGKVLLAIYTDILAVWSKNTQFTINLVEQPSVPIHSNAELEEAITQPNRNKIFSTLVTVNHLQTDSFRTRAKRITGQVKSALNHQSKVQLSQFSSLSEETLEKLKAILGISFVIE